MPARSGKSCSSLRFAIFGTLLGLTWPLAAQAGKQNAAPLQVLPAAKLRALAPLLRSTDIALIESQPDGTLKQITTMTLVAAPPATVRDALLHAERYPDFVRNTEVSRVTQNPDGTFDHFYKFGYTFFSLDGSNRYEQLPPDPAAGDVPPVDIYDTDTSWSGTRHYRWEFYQSGGGTLLVMYGYTNIRNSGGVVGKLMKRLPSLEHGLALVSQMAMPLAMKSRAEQLTQQAGTTVELPPAAAVSYDFLVERGVVVLLRSSNGRLSEMSMIDRTRARPDTIIAAAQRAGQWSGYIPTFTRSTDHPVQSGIPVVELELSLPMLSFTSKYGIRSGGSTVDMLSVEGELRGSRVRWDVKPGPNGQNQIVLRTIQQLDRASMVLSQLYKMEPLFEYGINVGLQLVLLNGIKARAEKDSGIPPRVPPAPPPAPPTISAAPPPQVPPPAK